MKQKIACFIPVITYPILIIKPWKSQIKHPEDVEQMVKNPFDQDQDQGAKYSVYSPGSLLTRPQMTYKK